MSSGPLQPQRDGSGRGGWHDLGEGCICEARGDHLSRRLSSHLWLRLLGHYGPRVSTGAGSVRGQRRSLPALLLLLLAPSWEQTDHPALPALQPGKLFESVQGDQVLNEQHTPNQKSEESHVPHFPLTPQRLQSWLLDLHG